MNKQTNFIFMLLIFVGAFVAIQYFMKSDKPQQTDQNAPANQPQSMAATQFNPSDHWLIKPATPQNVVIGDNLDPKTFYMQLDIDAAGASITSASLTDYFETVQDKQLYDKDPAAYPQAAAADPQKYKGHYKVLRPIDYKDNKFRSLETRMVRLYPGDNEQVDFTRLRSNPWTLVEKTTDPTTGTQRAVFEWTIYRNKAKDPKKYEAEKFVTLRKIFAIQQRSYSIDMRLEATSHTDKPFSLDMLIGGPVGLDRQDSRSDGRMVVTAQLKEDSIQPVNYDVKKLIEWPYGQQHLLGTSTDPQQPMIWFGLVNKYFGGIVYIDPKNPQMKYDPSVEADYFAAPIQAAPEGTENNGRAWETSMQVRNISLTPGQTRGFDLNVFVGPKIREMFNSNPLYSQLRYVDTISNQSCSWCTINWLVEILMWMLSFFATKLFLGNYGLAIMLLVFIVRLALHPLTKKGQISMMKMQKRMGELKPQMDKIREKYANDKQKMQTELLKLQKEHGNPMADGLLGCMPMLLQMPIWVALYSALSSSVALRHAAFLPFWITDLAAPDKLFVFSKNIPVIGGWDFNLLPILLTVAMFFQQKFMSPPSSAAMTPEQQQQQKMMKFLMPIMMLFIFYSLPSGLNLYIMASSTVGVFEQMRIRKHIREKEELEAASETVIDAGNRTFRGNRPKKPKGPFNVK